MRLLPLHRFGNYRPTLFPAMSDEQRIGGQYGEIRAEIDIASLNDFLRRECPRIETPVEVKQFKVSSCLSIVGMSDNVHSLDRCVSNLTAAESVLMSLASRIRPTSSRITRESIKLVNNFEGLLGFFIRGSKYVMRKKPAGITATSQNCRSVHLTPSCSRQTALFNSTCSRTRISCPERNSSVQL